MPVSAHVSAQNTDGYSVIEERESHRGDREKEDAAINTFRMYIIHTAGEKKRGVVVHYTQQQCYPSSRLHNNISFLLPKRYADGSMKDTSCLMPLTNTEFV